MVSRLTFETEVCKTAVTHYFKPDKARDLLGYEPFVTAEEGMKRVVKHYQDMQLPHGPSSATIGLMAMCLAVLLAATLLQVYGVYWMMFT